MFIVTHPAVLPVHRAPGHNNSDNYSSSVRKTQSSHKSEERLTTVCLRKILTITLCETMIMY